MKIRNEINVRWMVRRDLREGVLDIERDSFHTDAQWVEDDFLEAMMQREYTGLIAEYGPSRARHVVGYAVYYQLPAALTILNLAVSPDYRRCKVGTSIIDTIKSRLCPLGVRRTRISTLVDANNYEAMSFLKRNKFRPFGIDETGELAFQYSKAFDYVYKPLPEPAANTASTIKNLFRSSK